MIVAAVVALGAVALTDALRDRTAAEEPPDAAVSTGEVQVGETPTVTSTVEVQVDETPTAATTVELQFGGTPTASAAEGRPPEARLPGEAASGLLAYTAPGDCELRAVDVRSGRMLELPRLETSCELYAPRVGSRVAYTLQDEGSALRHFSVLDLENPRAGFGDYQGYWSAWSPDGSTLAWCDSLGSGFELSRGQRPKRRDRCPRAYDPSGATVSVKGRRQIVVGGRPLLRARGPVWHLAWGVDGSLAVLVEGGRLDRYEGGRLVGTGNLTPPSPEHPVTIWPPELAPDNCAALSVGGDVVRLVDLGCFRGRAPRMFQGVYADWSPDGEWIAVAEADAVVFHRVVGPEESVRWNVAAGQLAWLGG